MSLKRYNVPPRYANAQASDFQDNVRTIVTSNFELQEIKSWDDAVSSRLSGLCQIELYGEDKRKQEA